MKKLLVLLPLLLLILAPAVLAKGNDKNQTGANNARFEVKIKGQTQTTQDSTPSAQPACDPGANWKNHGAYVSCVAHLEPGPHRLGGPGNSVAARSNVGKPFQPPATPSATPSATTPPEATPTPEATPSSEATTSADVEVEIKVKGPLSQVIIFLEQVLNLLKNLVL